MANCASLACMVTRSVSASTVVGQLRSGAPQTHSGTPAYQALAEGLRRLVADGRILDGPASGS